jgi:hypothetical protein
VIAIGLSTARQAGAETATEGGEAGAKNEAAPPRRRMKPSRGRRAEACGSGAAQIGEGPAQKAARTRTRRAALTICAPDRTSALNDCCRRCNALAETTAWSAEVGRAVRIREVRRLVNLCVKTPVSACVNVMDQVYQLRFLSHLTLWTRRCDLLGAAKFKQERVTDDGALLKTIAEVLEARSHYAAVDNGSLRVIWPLVTGDDINSNI